MVCIEVGVEIRPDAAHARHNIPHAHLTSADLLTQVARLQRLGQRASELLRPVDGRQPEAERRRVVVARSAAVAFDERRSAEGLEARAGRVKRLACAVRTGARVLNHNTRKILLTSMSLSGDQGCTKAQTWFPALRCRFRKNRVRTCRSVNAVAV